MASFSPGAGGGRASPTDLREWTPEEQERLAERHRLALAIAQARARQDQAAADARIKLLALPPIEQTRKRGPKRKHPAPDSRWLDVGASPRYPQADAHARADEAKRRQEAAIEDLREAVARGHSVTLEFPHFIVGGREVVSAAASCSCGWFSEPQFGPGAGHRARQAGKDHYYLHD